MTLTTRLNELANQILAPANLRLGTLTADQQEKQRLVELARAGAFSKPIYPVPRCMEAFDPAPLKQAYEHHRDAIERLEEPGRRPERLRPFQHVLHDAGHGGALPPDADVRA